MQVGRNERKQDGRLGLKQLGSSRCSSAGRRSCSERRLLAGEYHEETDAEGLYAH